MRVILVGEVAIIVEFCCLYVYLAESQEDEVVELIPKSLVIPRSSLKMSNTSLGEGKPHKSLQCREIYGLTPIVTTVGGSVLC